MWQKPSMMLALVLSLQALPAYAQDAETAAPGRCVYSSKSFSQGATIPEGDGYITCSSSGAWMPSDKVVANCLYDGDVYGAGALVGLSGKDGAVLECGTNGHWKAR